MDPSHERYGEALDRFLDSRPAPQTPLAVAVITRPGAAPLVRFRPQDVASEPRFLIYSITKTFLAALFLLLEESRALSLDDALARWQPRVTRAGDITLRALLRHTAGIPDYGGLSAYHHAVRESPSTAWTFERFAAETYEKGLMFEPGEGWAYSNPGYILLPRLGGVTACVIGAEAAGFSAEQVVFAIFDALARERAAGPRPAARRGAP